MLTFTVTNNGPYTATGVVLTENLPAGFTFSNAPGLMSVSPTGNTLRFRLVDLPRGGTATMSILVTPRTAGDFTTTASVAGNESDPNTADNSAQASTVVIAPADLITTTTSTTNHATNARLDLPAATVYHTRVIGVLASGAPVLFDMTTDHAPNSAEVNALFTQANQQLRNAGAVKLSTPALTASSNITGPKLHVGDQTVVFPSGVNDTWTTSYTVGPTTIVVGENQSQSFFIPIGASDVNTNRHHETFVNNLYQATITRTATYTIKGFAFNNLAKPKTYTVDVNSTLDVSALMGLLNQPHDAETTLHLVAGSITNLPAGQVLNVNPNGSFIFKPKKNFVGQLQFTYRLIDGERLSDPITVTLIVVRHDRWR